MRQKVPQLFFSVFFAAALALSVVVAGEQRADLQRVEFRVPDQVQVLPDIVYAQGGGRDLHLDLYRPTSGAVAPGVIVIRGGGWRAGDKEGFAHIAGFLAAEGFAAVSIEYRVVPEAPFPAAIEDAKAAVRWLRANASAHGIDPDRIGAIGGSAGAHLAALLGTSHKAAALEGSGGHPNVSSRVQAVVAMAVPSDFTVPWSPTNGLASVEYFLHFPFDDAPELWGLASPRSHVDHDSAPVLLMHSDVDSVVPHEQSELLLNDYERVGVAAKLVTVSDAPHAFWNFTKWFDDAMSQSAQFLSLHLAAE